VARELDPARPCERRRRATGLIDRLEGQDDVPLQPALGRVQSQLLIIGAIRPLGKQITSPDGMTELSEGARITIVNGGDELVLGPPPGEGRQGTGERVRIPCEQHDDLVRPTARVALHERLHELDLGALLARICTRRHAMVEHPADPRALALRELCQRFTFGLAVNVERLAVVELAGDSRGEEE
jgi:hypothetical protein